MTKLITIILAALALSACGRKGWSDTVPMEAAAEATLVCQPFGGLKWFTIENRGMKEQAEGPALLSLTITATCKSEHIVTGVIGVKV